MSERIQAAPGARACCDGAGRMVRLALVPSSREVLIARAVASGEGTREEIEQRIADMLAAGLLLELELERGA